MLFALSRKKSFIDSVNYVIVVKETIYPEFIFLLVWGIGLIDKMSKR